MTLAPLDLTVPDTLAELHAIWRAAYAQEAALLGVPAAHFPPLQRSAADLQATPWQFIGAWKGAMLQGALALGPEGDAMRVMALVVAPAAQRQGIGRQLMAAALAQWAGQPMSLATGEANTPALALYRSLGFIERARETVGEPPVAIVRLWRAAD